MLDSIITITITSKCDNFAFNACICNLIIFVSVFPETGARCFFFIVRGARDEVKCLVKNGRKTIFVWDFPHFVIASEIYLFVPESKCLSCGLYLACRLDSTSKNSYRVLFFDAF